MNKKLFLTLVAIMSLAAMYAQQPFLWAIDPLTPVYPDSNKTSGLSNRLELDIPRSTKGEAQFLLHLPVSSAITVKAYLDGKQIPLQHLYTLVDVPVEQNTGLDSRTEMFKNTINPYVVRRAPFRIYEVIRPLQAETFSTTAAYTVIRVELPPALTGKAGTYTLALKVSAGQANNANSNGSTHNGGNASAGGSAESSFSAGSSAADKFINASATTTLHVHNVKLPELQQSRFFYTNWFNIGHVGKGLERWSDAWYAELEKWVKLMASGRQNAVIIPGELISSKDGKIMLDEKNLERYVNLFRKYGFRYFESSHLMWRGPEDDWRTRELKTVYSNTGFYSPKAEQEIRDVVTLIRDFNYKHQLTNSWMQHISDEPTATQSQCYKDVVKLVKSVYPEIRIMEATNDRDSLIGGVDVWCPLINDFQENESFFREREKNKEQVLVYTCLIPGGKWLNRLLDQEKLRMVYFGWGAYRYKTSGFLHWALNQYHGDPYTYSVLKHTSPAAGPENFLPAGDTHIVYPGADGPLSSIRFESHRLGVEDFEMLTDLGARNPGTAENLTAQLFRTYTDYETEVAVYRKVRREVLRRLAVSRKRLAVSN